MPELKQGNIFDATQHDAELSVVFGHIGFNTLAVSWYDFQETSSIFYDVRDPFNELANEPIELPNGKWIWFIPAGDNHGLTEAQLEIVLDKVFVWASREHIKSVATNGIANIDHSTDTLANRESDKKRVEWLVNYTKSVEEKYGLSIQLISLNDVFLR